MIQLPVSYKSLPRSANAIGPKSSPNALNVLLTGKFF